MGWLWLTWYLGQSDGLVLFGQSWPQSLRYSDGLIVVGLIFGSIWWADLSQSWPDLWGSLMGWMCLTSVDLIFRAIWLADCIWPALPWDLQSKNATREISLLCYHIIAGWLKAVGCVCVHVYAYMWTERQCIQREGWINTEMGTLGSQTTWHGNGDWMIDLKGHEFGGRDVNSFIHIEIGIAAS